MSQQCLRSKSIPKRMQFQKGSMVFGYASRTADMKFFENEITQFEEQGKIPDLTMEANYTIYRWKAGFGGHESIVVGFNGKYFTIEIRVLDNIATLYTTAENINVTKLEECGQKLVTGRELLNVAGKVYRQTKGYNYAGNNCQNFVNNFLEAIEMYDQVKDTDASWLFKVGSIALIGMGALAGLASMRNNRRH